MAYSQWFWNVVTTKKGSVSCSLILHCHILTTSNIYSVISEQSHNFFYTLWKKRNLGHQIPSGVSQGKVMFSSTFLLNCRCLKPCIKLKLIKLVSLTNHQFVEKKKCPVIFFSIFNANIWINFRKLKLTAVLIWFVPVMLIAVKPGQTPAPCP